MGQRQCRFYALKRVLEGYEDMRCRNRALDGREFCSKHVCQASDDCRHGASERELKTTRSETRLDTDVKKANVVTVQWCSKHVADHLAQH